MSKVKAKALKLFPSKNLSVEAVGSFRRGKEMCGDVDILITSNDPSTTKAANELKEIPIILNSIVSALEKDGFLLERLGANRVAKTGS